MVPDRPGPAGSGLALAPGKAAIDTENTSIACCRVGESVAFRSVSSCSVCVAGLSSGASRSGRVGGGGVDAAAEDGVGAVVVVVGLLAVVAVTEVVVDASELDPIDAFPDVAVHADTNISTTPTSPTRRRELPIGALDARPATAA